MFCDLISDYFYLSPIPSYNWTRLDGPMPRHARLESYNRVLSIPNVKVEDQGEYMCTIFNDKASLQKSVRLNVQSEPNFTIPLTNKHADIKSDLIWVCEAFGIPEVNYTWWRNGRQLGVYMRIKINLSLLKILLIALNLFYYYLFILFHCFVNFLVGLVIDILKQKRFQLKHIH